MHAVEKLKLNPPLLSASDPKLTLPTETSSLENEISQLNVSTEDKKEPVSETKESSTPTTSPTTDGDLNVETDSPLVSKYRFEDLGLREELLKGVYRMGFFQPSKIQSIALPSLLRQDHFIGQAQSGSGKTAAYSLGILSRCDEKEKKVQALCICPTVELARQTKEVIEKLGSYTQLTTDLVVGGDKKRKITSHIVVGTPGRLSDFVRARLLDLQALKILIVDEADEIIGMSSSMWTQVSNVRKTVPKSCQIGCFSATYADKVKNNLNIFVPTPRTTVSLKVEELSVEKIRQFYIRSEKEEQKYEVLVNIFAYLSFSAAVVFTETKRSAELLKKKLNDDGHAVLLLHGDLPKPEREEILEKFKLAEAHILISTNLLSRGIDIDSITLVINFDIPRLVDERKVLGPVDPETYLHRIGRTGRFGRSGIAINLVHTDEGERQIKEIEAYFSKEIVKVEQKDTVQWAQDISK